MESHTFPITDDFLLNFQVVIVTEATIENLLHINNFCRNHGIKFISGDIRGVFAYAFTDFGDEFTVIDPRGEQPTTYMIEGITKVCQLHPNSNTNPPLITNYTLSSHFLYPAFPLSIFLFCFCLLFSYLLLFSNAYLFFRNHSSIAYCHSILFFTFQE